ncbi:MAG: type II secretion system F family protein [Planctomycetota bacterium]|jgi:type IV pilus assembly protein PilC
MFFIPRHILFVVCIFLAVGRPKVGVWISLGLGVLCLLQGLVHLAAEEFEAGLEALSTGGGFLWFPMIGALLAPSWPGPAGAHRSVAQAFAGIIIVFIALMTVVLWLGGGGATVGAVTLCSPGCIVLLVLMAFVARYRRRSLATYVFSTLSSIVRRNMPLAKSLEAEGRGRGDLRSAICRAIAADLRRGMPLSEALVGGYPSCPGDCLAIVGAGERAGRLSGALTYVERLMAQQRRQDAKPRHVGLAYPVFVLALIIPLAQGMDMFVLPKFKEIFLDMHASLPPVTAILSQVSRLSAPAMPVLLLGIIVAVILWLYTSFRPRRASRPQWLTRWGDAIRWCLPPMRWVDRSAGRQTIAGVLRLSLSSGMTVDQAIASAAEMDVNGRWRARTRRWLERVRSGQSPSIAAGEAGMGPALTWAFDEQVNGGQTMAALEAVEEISGAQHHHLRNVSRSVIWPIIVLMLAVVVGFFVVAIIAPLAHMQAEFVNVHMP